VTEAEQRQLMTEFDHMGETQVRIRLAQGDWGVRGEQFAVASEWLRLEEEKRNEARLSISRDANSIARSALRMSKIAMILSAAATIIAAIIAVFI